MRHSVRYVRPGFLIFIGALLASLGVHLPVYEVLGVLADAFLADAKAAERAQASEPVEFTLEPLPQDSDEGSEPERESDRPERQRPPKPEPRVKRPPPPKPIPKVAPEPPPQAVPPLKPQEQDTRHAVQQRSDDPNVEPPPDARYLAEQNRRVEEETVATITNLKRDDVPEAGQTASEDTQPGADEDEDLVRETRDRAGDEADREARERTVQALERSQRQPSPQQPAHVPGQGGKPGVETPEQPDGAPSPEFAQDDDVIVLNDGNGTIIIRKPRPAQGPAGTQGERSSGSSGPRQPELALNFQQYEAMVGADNLREQREAYAEQVKSRSRGGSRQRRWRKFKAALENYVTQVKPGNQTALNAAASPFAAYLATIHRRIHIEYALGFLKGLPISGGPFDDAQLRTTLEIVINSDGTVHQIGIVETSGLLPFDFGAFDAVMRAGPFTAPPASILSEDGRVYLHWGFYRNSRQCGTFNAKPFILRGNTGGASGTPPAMPPLRRRNRGQPPQRNSKGSEMGLAPQGPIGAPELPGRRSAP